MTLNFWKGCLMGSFTQYVRQKIWNSLTDLCQFIKSSFFYNLMLQFLLIEPEKERIRKWFKGIRTPLHNFFLTTPLSLFFNCWWQKLYNEVILYNYIILKWLLTHPDEPDHWRLWILFFSSRTSPQKHYCLMNIQLIFVY